MLDWCEQILQEERREGGPAAQAGLRVDRSCLCADRSFAGDPRGGDFFQAQTLQYQQADVPLRLGQFPRQELAIDRLAEALQERPRFVAPLPSLNARQVQVPD